MNCNEVAEVLNGGRWETLQGQLRTEINAHAGNCDDCAAALTAQRTLELDPPPAVPSDLFERVMPATSFRDPLPRVLPKRRDRRLAVAAGVLALGGAVFAAVTLLTTEASLDADETAGGLATDPESEPTESVGADTPAGEVAATVIDFVDSAVAEEQQRFTAALMNSGSLPDGDMFPLLKVAPRYPVDAAVRGIEGFAVVEFTVTERGDVADVTIVESSDPLFEPPSIEAANGFKYKPRVESGLPMSVSGIRNRINYVLDRFPPSEQSEDSGDSNPSEDGRAEDSAAAANAATERQRTFDERMKPTLECLEAGNLLCIELQLDEIVATHELTPQQAAEISRIYGFVHHRQGNFELAIEAYERASGRLAESDGYWYAGPLMIVARIHYDRGQYQQALDAAIEYLKAAPNPSVGDYVFADELRRLGATVR